MTAKIAGGVAQMVLDRNLSASCFYLKCRAGWRERDPMTISGGAYVGNPKGLAAVQYTIEIETGDEDDK